MEHLRFLNVLPLSKEPFQSLFILTWTHQCQRTVTEGSVSELSGSQTLKCLGVLASENKNSQQIMAFYLEVRGNYNKKYHGRDCVWWIRTVRCARITTALWSYNWSMSKEANALIKFIIVTSKDLVADLKPLTSQIGLRSPMSIIDELLVAGN